MRARGECVWKYITLDIKAFETTNVPLVNLPHLFRIINIRISLITAWMHFR